MIISIFRRLTQSLDKNYNKCGGGDFFRIISTKMSNFMDTFLGELWEFSMSACSKIAHSLIRGVLIQSCPAGAKNFTNYVFCYVQFSGVIQNIENRCAILTPICLCRLLSK